MDQPKYSTLYAALQAMTDPRDPRGQRFAWPLLLTLLSAALASGHTQVWAMAHWAALHAAEIICLLNLERPRLPSVSTLYRAARQVDVAELEAKLADYAAGLRPPTATQTLPLPTAEPLQAQAIDGKDLRGASAHGSRRQLVSLVQHSSSVVLAERAVAPQQGEASAVAALLAGRDLRGVVITLDAGLAQRSLVQQILDQGGHYLVVIKGNHPTLRQDIQLLFEQPVWLVHERAHEYRHFTYSHKGHGRVEVRTLESSCSLNTYLAWPHVGQVLRRTCRRVEVKAGRRSQQTTYGVTSLPWAAVTAEQLEQVWRGHWTIENRLHYVRDVTLDEDHSQLHVGSAPQALAALRNAVLNTLRAHGHTHIAAALREYGASLVKAFALIGAIPNRL